MKKTIYNQNKWGVHITGPDSYLAAESFAEASRKAHGLNEGFEKASIDHINYSEYDPIVLASVILWPEVNSHNPEDVNWDDVF